MFRGVAISVIYVRRNVEEKNLDVKVTDITVITTSASITITTTTFTVTASAITTTKTTASATATNTTIIAHHSESFHILLTPHDLGYAQDIYKGAD